MLDEHLYKADRAAAKSRGHLFSVATKEKRGARWIEVHTEIDDLHAAMMPAQNLLAYEVGIFVNGGFIYWTSIHPDLFNSTAINLRISGRDAQS